MKVVIMAGGKGTRIRSIAADIPKPMIKVAGKPILEHQIEILREQGFLDIIITVEHLSQSIIDYFGDGRKISGSTGKPFGVSIKYYIEDKPMGNAGALIKLKDNFSEDFLLLNGDIVFDVDLKRFVNFHNDCGGLATVFTHPNTHPYDSGLIVTSPDNIVQEWISKDGVRPRYYKNKVNAGIHILSPESLNLNTLKEKVDLDKDILQPLAGTGKLFAYSSSEYVFDMGTPERYARVCHDYRAGLPYKKNLTNRQKAIFLDRDGTINKYKGFLSDINSFELMHGVIEAIKRINNSDYLAIVVTNQPAIARGELTCDQLNEIHNKLETLIGEQGAYLDSTYFCPHHPEKGFLGEVPELKISCQCRKPSAGLLFKAADDFNIDLSKSWMIGDDKRDILAGKNAGCKTALIGNDDFGQDVKVKSLEDFVERILWQ